MKEMETIIERAKAYATERHAFVNHTYDGQPYTAHLEPVAHFAEKYAELLPERLRETAVAVAWCHDIIEDTRETYNDVKYKLGPMIADAVYALTNEKGRNRAERANDKYYQGIQDNLIARFVKTCDRLANAQYSLSTKSNMFFKYRQEHQNFRSKLCIEELAPMFEELEMMFIKEA
jgi:(p)ppGpp synthase/HD superfamily hydrolase